MQTNRLEAFSDGVLAIAITVMVLEMKVPHGDTWAALAPLLPKFLSYVLSFIYVGIYWNNHHHMMIAAKHVNGTVLWANLHLLFWLSLLPFATGWLGENHFSSMPTAMYGFVLLMAALAYYLLEFSIIRIDGEKSTLASAIGDGGKGKLSLVIYALAMALSFVATWLAHLLYIAVAVLWFLPDKRIEKAIAEKC